MGPLSKWPFHCLYIGLTNYLLTGMILQARTVGTGKKQLWMKIYLVDLPSQDAIVANEGWFRLVFPY